MMFTIFDIFTFLHIFFILLLNLSGPLDLRGGGELFLPQIFANMLTLFQSGVTFYAHHFTTIPLDF